MGRKKFWNNALTNIVLGLRRNFEFEHWMIVLGLERFFNVNDGAILKLIKV